MQLRPSRPRHAAAAAVAVLALAASLSSCGFDYATDRYYTPGSGANTREGTVDVLSAVLVSAAEGSGTFVASLSNNDTEGEASFTGISGGAGSDISAEFDPVDITPGGIVNLADPEAGIVVTGEFGPGDSVPLTFDFGDGERVDLNVPVVADDSGYWEGLDAS